MLLFRTKVGKESQQLVGIGLGLGLGLPKDPLLPSHLALPITPPLSGSTPSHSAQRPPPQHVLCFSPYRAPFGDTVIYPSEDGLPHLADVGVSCEIYKDRKYLPTMSSVYRVIPLPSFDILRPRCYRMCVGGAGRGAATLAERPRR